MRTRPVPIALAALALIGLARIAPPALAAGAPLSLDSLQVEELPRFTLYAPDVPTLQLAHREVNQATNTLRRLVGTYPSKIVVAVLGPLDDPGRVPEGELEKAGVHLVVTDWPERRGRASDSTGRAAPVPLAERVGRWQLRDFERRNARTPVPAGRERLVPDWFESAVGQLCLNPPDQSRRLAWFRERLDTRIPLTRLFTMPRPAAALPARAARGGTGARTMQPGAAERAALQRELFDTQSLAFARFVAAVESERMLGDVLHAYLRGEPETAALNTGKNLYTRHDLLERAFVDWVRALPAR